MGAIMINCPETGQGIPTGYEADPARFRKTPVFFARAFCPICRAEHEWFARDAWVHVENHHFNRCKAATPSRERRIPQVKDGRPHLDGRANGL